jgi:hypothetical protein
MSVLRRGSAIGTAPAILAIACALFCASSFAQDITALWASTVVSSSGVNSVDAALGRPDAIRNAFNDFATATFGGFGDDETDAYNAVSLASLLGISPGLLRQANFLMFEYNGDSLAPETSTWVFSDGTHSDTLNWHVNDPAGGMVLARGSVDRTNYFSYFAASGPNQGHYSYLLLDIGGTPTVNVLSPNFTVSVTAGAGNPQTPDIDALAVLVPEPAACSLWIGALVSLAATTRQRQRCEMWLTSRRPV